MIEIFTSTGQKLLRHPDLIQSWKEGCPVPHSLQVALTEKCNLNCKFCSVANRERKYEWNLDDLISATEKFIRLGTKTVEITGGGEPLCYPDIFPYVHYLINRGMRIGLITNGIGINLHLDWVRFIDWLRISANVYDYLGKIELPSAHMGTLGFSYVWTEGISSLETLRKIKKIALENRVDYIRLVPDCTKDIEKQNEFLEKIAEEIGPPLFLQRKIFKSPNHCYWGYLKPFLYCDGYVYPCSSMVLNLDADKQFHESYRVCHWTEIEKIWGETVKSLVDTAKCGHCVFSHQNEMLEYSLSKQSHEEFI